MNRKTYSEQNDFMLQLQTFSRKVTLNVLPVCRNCIFILSQNVLSHTRNSMEVYTVQLKINYFNDAPFISPVLIVCSVPESGPFISAGKGEGVEASTGGVDAPCRLHY